MSISIRARRTAIVSFAIALIAASCALPEYEVGESSSGTAATGSTATAGGSQTSSSTGTGGAGGAGGGGQGGAGGSDGGAGGSNIPKCPDPRPTIGSPCSWPGFPCTYPSEGNSCCDDEIKCIGSDPAKSTWEVVAKQINCPPPDCPQDCSPMCLAEPPPPSGCFCRVEKPLLCNYNHCAENGAVQQVGCAPPVNPGGKSLWQNMGAHPCCNPEAGQQCPGCATHQDVNGQPVSFCP
jgi:hypothetical protein